MNVDVHQILRDANEQKRKRADQIPDVHECLRLMMQVHLRLKEMGWNEPIYAPKDGTTFEVLTFGSTGIFKCRYLGEWPKGGFFVEDGGDLWPSDPIAYRLLPN